MKKFGLILLAMLPLLCGCKARSLEKEAAGRIEQLSAMSELGTVEYTISKTIRADKSRWYAIGEKKILFTCTAHLKAGIDLSKADWSLTKVDGKSKSVTVTLPHATLLSFNMPPKEIRVAYQKSSLMRGEFTAEERNEILKLGEEDIKAGVPELGILEDAERNAAAFFNALLTGAGFRTVEVNFE